MIHYLPINIPPIVPITWDGMKKENYAWWSMIKITEETTNRYDQSTIKPEFLEQNPYFEKWLEHLPIKKLIKCVVY